MRSWSWPRLDVPVPALDAARDGVGDRLEQAVLGDRLGQEVHGAEAHRPHRRRHVAVGAHQQHAEHHLLVVEPRQQLETGAVGHAQVEQQAAGRVDRAAAIEVVDSRIGADVPAVRTEQALEAPPHRRVVI